MAPYKQPSLAMTAGVQEHTLVALETQTPTARTTALAVANDSRRLRSNSIGLPQKTHVGSLVHGFAFKLPLATPQESDPIRSMPFCTPIMIKKTPFPPPRSPFIPFNPPEFTSSPLPPFPPRLSTPHLFSPPARSPVPVPTTPHRATQHPLKPDSASPQFPPQHGRAYATTNINRLS